MNKKIILLITGLILFLIVLILIIILVKNNNSQNSQPNTNASVELTYWGVFMPEQVMNPIIEKYQSENPNVKINYQERSFNDDLGDYKNTLKTRLTNGSGPDIFRMHSTWSTPFYSQLSLENDAMTDVELKSEFYPVVSTQCRTRDAKVICIPLMYDGLVLLYNVDMFKDEGVLPPTTWEELRTISARLTKRDSRGNPNRSGVALGTSNNISNASDILSILMLQNGVSLPDGIDSPEGKTALEFYKSFEKNRIWTETMPESPIAFASEKTAMVFAKRWEILEILELNPTLNFGVTTIPQVPKLDGTTTNNTWASFWVESVSNDSSKDEQREAWKFLHWLSEPEQQKAMFDEFKKYYRFGEIYSSVALRNDIINTPILGPFVEQALTSSTWLTADTSGNDVYVKVFNDAIGNSEKVLPLEEAEAEIIKRMKKDGYR